MLAELYGRETGCARGRGGSQHLIDLDVGFVASAPILAATVPIAVGLAFSVKRLGLDRVTVVYFGDGAVEEGTCYEAMNFAAVHRLSVVFVCENNLYSVHSAMDVRQPAGRPISSLAKAHGFPGFSADGNDVDAVRDLAEEAVNRARHGGGPTLLEFETYRLLEHCGVYEDGKLGYRSQDEIDSWIERCPVKRMKNSLRREGCWDDAENARLEKRLDEEIAEAFKFAESSPYPDPRSFGDFTLP